jgi:hypothetical protein
VTSTPPRVMAIGTSVLGADDDCLTPDRSRFPDL